MGLNNQNLTPMSVPRFLKPGANLYGAKLKNWMTWSSTITTPPRHATGDAPTRRLDIIGKGKIGRRRSRATTAGKACWTRCRTGSKSDDRA